MKCSSAWSIALGLGIAIFNPIAAEAQSTPQTPWSADIALGWDPSISGDFIAAGIGTINGVPTVFQSQSFGDVYGTGMLWQFGVGYMLDERNEVRGQFTYQGVGADAVELGTVGTSTLVATFDDYKASSFEAGYRRYFADRDVRLRPYAGGSLGLAIISEIDGVLAAPEAGLVEEVTDFYDGTISFAFAINGGLLIGVTPRIDVSLQLGFRFISGLEEVDGLQGTGLEDTNDKSSRWTLPFLVGARFRF